MSNYDGPSFFRDNHPKIQPMVTKQQKKKEQSKYELPKTIRTHDHLQNEARQHMTNRKTPSHGLPHDPPPERYPFKNKYIPPSLKNLDGWRNNDANKTLYTIVKERLQKEKGSYLLFEEHLSDEMKAKNQKRQSTNKDAVNNVVPEPKNEIRKEIVTPATKPGTGLHRSLSNIMAEEQRVIQKSQSKLNNLFKENEKNERL